jgi:hypothetical protein
VAAAVGAVAYLYTPLTAAGPKGDPVAFFSNMRYVIPSLAVALVLLPIAPPMMRPRVRWPALALLAAVFAITTLSTEHWRSPYLLGVAFMVLALVIAPVGLTLARERGVPRLAVVGVALAVMATGAALGWRQQRGYERNRYADATRLLGHTGPNKALSWARDVRDSRIGIAGSGEIFFAQYAFYGEDLSNYVGYVGRPILHGGLRPIESCREWRQRVNAGHYRYLVVTRYETPGELYPIADWTMTDPAAKLVNTSHAHQKAFVFRLTGMLDPGACPAEHERASRTSS